MSWVKQSMLHCKAGYDRIWPGFAEGVAEYAKGEAEYGKDRNQGVASVLHPC